MEILYHTNKIWFILLWKIKNIFLDKLKKLSSSSIYVVPNRKYYTCITQKCLVLGAFKFYTKCSDFHESNDRMDWRTGTKCYLSLGLFFFPSFQAENGFVLEKYKFQKLEKIYPSFHLNYKSWILEIGFEGSK